MLSYCVVFACLGLVHMATVTIYQDANPKPYTLQPVTYDSMISTKDLLREFKDYGVPPDIARAYVPMEMPDKDNKVPMTRGQIKGGDTDHNEETQSSLDPWSIVWYIGSFGGLIAFFLVVSCSEWCCARDRSRGASTPTGSQNGQGSSPPRHAPHAIGTPPPAYHLFAPPPYDTIAYQEKTDRYEVYVVPVHAMSVEFVERHQNTSEMGAEMAPPAYTSLEIPPT